MRNVLLFIAVAIAIGRFLVPVEGVAKEDLFKDAAHLFVGFAFGYAAYARTKIDLWAIPVALTVVEVVAFFIRTP